MAAIIVLLVAHACPASLHTCTLCSGLGMGLNAFAVRRLSQPMKWHKSSTFTLSQSSDSFYLCKPLMLPLADLARSGTIHQKFEDKKEMVAADASGTPPGQPAAHLR